MFTYEYTPSSQEQKLYDLLYTYINKPNKLAFPEMETYDLALRLLSLQSSSTAAIAQTVKGILKRLEKMPNAEEEIAQLQSVLDACQSIPMDTKAKELLKVLDKGFALMKKAGAAKKAVIFTESVETQKMLHALLSKKYKAVVYNGSADYSAIQQFKRDGEVLISTDNGAKGFNLKDFISKNSIALKEIAETEYWLELLYKTEYLSQVEFESIQADSAEIAKMLTAIVKTTKMNKENNC